MKLKISFLFFIFINSEAFSGTVTMVKNNKILLDFKNEIVNVKDQFFILNAENKKVAIVQVAILKNEKAIAEVLKGTALYGQKTMPRPMSKSSESLMAAESEFIRFDLLQIGFHFKYISNSIAAKQQDTTIPFPNQETVTMTGGNFGMAISADNALSDWLKTQSEINYEILDITGTAQFNSCDGKTSKNCTTKITYLGLQGLIRYDFIALDSSFWVGLGGAVKFLISKNSTALNIQGLTHSDSMTFATGVDFHLNNKNYLPVSLEYQYSMNTSVEVPEIRQINLVVGYGLKF